MGSTNISIYYLYLGILGITVFISSCGSISRTSRDNPKPPPNISFPDKNAVGNKIEEGRASWYGPNFHGKLTANGERYDMRKLTAAHRTLPFNTILKVKNLDNGKEVMVRINDRGPFAKNRIIDLSRRAASKIDMIGNGTAHVALMLMDDSLRHSRTTNLKVATYTVQLGSFADKAKAKEEAKKIKGARVETINLPQQTVYRIYYGTFEKKSDARRKQQELKRRGLNGYVKQIQN